MMLLQSSHCVVDCPICGRPLEMPSQLVSHEIVCGHCRGEFTVYETDDGSLTTGNRSETDLLKRAEQLLRATGDTELPAAGRRYERLLSSVPVLDNEGLPDDSCLSPLEEAECEAESLPTVLLVEYRDEVFARITTDIAEFGFHVVRATSAREPMQFCGTNEPVLVVANVDLPDHSGWLLAGKLRFVDRHNRIWLYQTESSNYDLGMVNFLNVDELLDYQGDLLGLSETIFDLMTNWHEECSAGNDVRNLVVA